MQAIIQGFSTLLDYYDCFESVHNVVISKLALQSIYLEIYRMFFLQIL